MRSRARGGHVSHWYIFRKPNFFNRAVSPNEVEVRNIMEWRDLEVWRRQRPYITAELRKDALDQLARLGLATSFALLVGMAEGARMSATKGDIKFPLRYAIYNVIPSFVGGKVPPASVASTMASAPPISTCPRAVAHATNLRALRTAAAGCTCISIIFQITLAGGRGAEAYTQAVVEGREVPSMNIFGPSGSSGSGSGAVVRLCGAQGLESALLASRQDGFKTPILPVVVASSRGSTAHCGIVSPCSVSGCLPEGLPEGGLSAVAKRLPQPCYFRVDPKKLFCREAWRPVTAKFSDSARLRGKIEVVLEADTLSSGVPQSLLACPPADMDNSRECENGWSGHLSADQAIWGLNMLRTGLEDSGRGDGVAGVVLSGTRLADLGDSVVSIDARAALLLSVVSWAEQCAAKVMDASNVPSSEGDPTAAVNTVDKKYSSLGNGESPALSAVLDVSSPDHRAKGQLETSRVDGEMETAKAPEAFLTEDPEAYDIVSRIFGALERVGRGVRTFVAPEGQLRSAINRCTSTVYSWLEKRKIITAGGTNRVFLYDTDDDNSFKWLAAQMLKRGWTVRRAADPCVVANKSKRRQEGSIPAIPVLVHRCTEERTLSAAAAHLARGTDGPPLCLMVHHWDCGVEARRLLLERKSPSMEMRRRGLVEVICTAEVGEDLFQYVRDQLQSGSTPAQVQAVLDDLLGIFYEGQGQ